MNYETYYKSLDLPVWAPPSNLFGIVWPFLYVLIIVSFGYVAYEVVAKKRWSKKLLIVFASNLIANALYTPLFFELKLPILALVDIFVVLGTIMSIIVIMWRRQRWVSILQLPYLTWVTFATCLQIYIVLSN